MVIVDVLSFTTCVDIATSNGAIIFPCRFRDDTANEFARTRNAVLAGSRGAAGGAWSLSPASLVGLPAGARLVLPSPNGSTLSLATGATPTLAGCLRNSRAVAAHAGRLGRRVAVIPCGERWPDGSLRPAVEDLIGAGAIISHLDGSRSPEARAAETVFAASRNDLGGVIEACASGQELIRRGFFDDVELASRVDCSKSAPLLRAESYINASAPC